MASLKEVITDIQKKYSIVDVYDEAEFTHSKLFSLEKTW